MSEAGVLTVMALPNDIDMLASLARAEGFRFLDKLITQWRDGTNRFDAPGEILCTISDADRTIAIGGLNRDPYLTDPRIGRLRHLYVHPAHRRSGHGRALVDTLIAHARASFSHIRLRTDTPAAARFYEALAFIPITDETASHILALPRPSLS